MSPSVFLMVDQVKLPTSSTPACKMCIVIIPVRYQLATVTQPIGYIYIYIYIYIYNYIYIIIYYILYIYSMTVFMSYICHFNQVELSLLN